MLFNDASSAILPPGGTGANAPGPYIVSRFQVKAVASSMSLREISNQLIKLSGEAAQKPSLREGFSLISRRALLRPTPSLPAPRAPPWIVWCLDESGGSELWVGIAREWLRDALPVHADTAARRARLHEEVSSAISDLLLPKAR